jgi:hypothetical protein
MDANPLIGVWSLVSDVARSSTGQQVFPLGEDPTGQLIYSPTGHVAVTMARRGRPRFASPDTLAGTDEEIKEAFMGFEAYAGTYDVDLEAGTVTHHIQVSKYPNSEDTSQLRHFKLSEGILELVTPPILGHGQEWVLTLSWRRLA